MNSNGHITERGTNVLETAMHCWNAASTFRKERTRNKDYTFGNQWGDKIVVDGVTMTEEEYIWSEGNVPLKNNLIRRLVRNVVGVFRQRLAESMKEWDAKDHDRALLNGMEELYGRSMEEFLVSGMAVHRKWRGRRNGVEGVWTDAVSPEAFFFDPMARDPRGGDISIIGQIHELRFRTFAWAFARGEREFMEMLRKYRGYRKVRVVEVWQRELRPRRLCHDRENARIIKVDEDIWRINPRLRRLPSKWIAEDVWRFYYVTADGVILREGDSPLPGGGHPYIFKAYPFLDGEIHSFVADIIDQQRYTNRLISLYDWVMRASAKGVLLFPEEAIPAGMSIDEVADEWGRFNGVIVYHPKAGQPIPQQVSSNTANVGIGELLSIQLKMMEDVSGISGALQGKLESQGISGQLYSQQTENALTSMRDILDTFNSFIALSLSRERELERGSV